jgi:hypothetical protein
MVNVKYKPQYANSWALIVGIDAYHYINQLNYACNDADAVASILMDELGFTTDKVSILKNADATKKIILDTYLSFHTKASNSDDRLLVFYAGHGHTVEGLRGPVGYLVPVDGDLNNLNSLIRWDELTQNAEVIPAKHILFVIDACYSGLAFRRSSIAGTQRFISDMLHRISRQVITAGKANEEVADGGGPQGHNSIFTGHLLEGLRGAAADQNGVMTANALMNYVYKRVGQDNRSQQTPQYGHIEGDGDFIFRTPNNEFLGQGLISNFLVKTAPEVQLSSRDWVIHGTRLVSDAVGKGFGPHGTYTSFLDRRGEVNTPKRGFLIADRMKSNDQYEQIGIEQMTLIARDVLSYVGDASKMAILLAYSMIEVGHQSLQSHFFSNDIIIGMEKAVRKVTIV